jgi:hypothetical protein
LTRLQHQQVATLASAEILRRTRHPRAAQRLMAAAEDLAAQIEAVEAGDEPRRRACLLCGCTQERACRGGCHWVAAPTGVDLCSRCTEVVDPCRLPRRIPADMRWVLDPDEEQL